MPLIVLTLVTVGSVALCWLTHKAWRRLRPGCEPPTFRCRVAVWDSASADIGGAFDRDPGAAPWHRFKARATWRGDTLIIRGWRPSRSWRMSVSLPAGWSIHEECPCVVRGLGPRPQSLIIPRAGTKTLKIAVREADRDRLVGPF